MNLNTIKISAETAKKLFGGFSVDGFACTVIDQGQMKAEDPKQGRFQSLVFEHENRYWQMDYRIIDEDLQTEWQGFHNPVTGDWECDEDVTCAEVQKQERVLTVWVPVENSV